MGNYYVTIRPTVLFMKMKLYEQKIKKEMNANYDCGENNMCTVFCLVTEYESKVKNLSPVSGARYTTGAVANRHILGGLNIFWGG